VSTSEQIVPPGHVLRYALKERLTHWVAAVAYIYRTGDRLALVAVVVLGGGNSLGGAPVSKDAASLGRLDFFAAVWNMYVHVGATDEVHGTWIGSGGKR